MKPRMLRMFIGIAIMLALAAGMADIWRENRQLWQMRQISAAYVEDDAPYAVAFGLASYEHVPLFLVNPGTELALYEPRHGAFLGAYIRSDSVVSGDIGRFEQLMGRHSIYKYFFDAEGGFPHDFALESVVMGRAPFFVLPQFLNEEETEALAREFGYYFSPMFVQPPMPNGNEDAAVYRADFAHMRRVFHEFAPHVAFVYTVDVANTDIAEEFYPGDGYTDWVGVHALASISPLRQFKGDVLTAVDQVYFAFQERKPMFVTIGISRQSNFDFIYRPRLAAEELRRVYTALLTDYPRVKGIIYMNVNEIRQGGAQNISDNYLITDDNMLKSTYRELVANENVIVQVAPGRAGMLSHETMRSRYSALRVGGNYYLHERTLTDELHVQRNRQRGRPRNSDGARYYPFATLNQGNEWILQSNEAHIMIIPRF